MTGQAPPARLLDLTRLVSRAGRMLTGVDRVERAYALELRSGTVPLFGLIRTSLGFLLLDRTGIGAILNATESGEWGSPDILSRLSFWLDRARQAGQSFARRQAVDRCIPAGLGRMLARHLPAGVTYLNVGHSNLGRRVLDAVRQVPQSRVVVMIHDTIPLDLPQMQRPGTVAGFAAKFGRVVAAADLILCPSEVSRGDILRHAGKAKPEVLAVPLGVRPVPPAPQEVPAGLDLPRAYFVALGTIEPRKNHALLLDVWADLTADLGSAAPHLLICGSRGWNNAEVFARLDARPAHVTELPGLSDGAVSALLAGSRGLVFPSLAEGYGLPLAEAAALGVSVICGDLAICGEVLGDGAVYLRLSDRYPWKNAVMAAMQAAGRPGRKTAFFPPTWKEHFKTVLRHC